MALVFSSQAAKALKAMPPKDAERLRRRLAAIVAGPAARHPGVIAMQGEAGTLRARQGDRRAIFSVEDGCVIVDTIADRKEAYR